MLERQAGIQEVEAHDPDGAAARPRVIVADADPLARRVIRDALQDDGAFVVVAEACDGVEAVELALHYQPELVVMEPTLPRLDGLDATRRIVEQAPKVQVVMLSAVTDPDLGVRSLRAGAIGFISKEVEMGVIAQALLAVVRGEAAISRSLTTSLIEYVRSVPERGTGMRPVRSVLTTREWEVLDLMRTGSSTSEIAAALVLSEDTIYSHIKNVMRKLEVHTRAEAVATADRLCGAA
jgi:two-component system, NarL family, response regulator LiaR